LSTTQTITGLPRGALVDGYRVEGVIGRQTGAGVVYVATLPSTGETLALKMLGRWLAEDDGAIARFSEDLARQSALDHEHIVRTRGTGESSAGTFLVMDLVRGTSLKKLIVLRELDERRAHDLLLPVAQALDHAHGCQFPHRDLKPQKIIVSRRAKKGAMLTDFGAAKPRRMSEEEFAENLETLEYAAPEQLRGEPVTGASKSTRWRRSSSRSSRAARRSRKGLRERPKRRIGTRRHRPSRRCDRISTRSSTS